MSLSQHSSQGAVGLTVADHACVSAFLLAQSGKVVSEGDTNEDYFALLPTAVEQPFDIDLGLTEHDALFFTERLLLNPTGFMLAAAGGPPIQLASEEVTAMREADGALADYECALGL
jgi:hypothetical protein